MLLVPIVVNHCARLYSHFLSSGCPSVAVFIVICFSLAALSAVITTNLDKYKKEKAARVQGEKVKNKIIIFFVDFLFFFFSFFLDYSACQSESCSAAQLLQLPECRCDVIGHAQQRRLGGALSLTNYNYALFTVNKPKISSRVCQS